MLSENQKIKVKSSFLNGKLKVKSANPQTKEVSLQPIKDVMQHHTGDKPSVLIETEMGNIHTTCDHSVFRFDGSNGIVPVRSDNLKSGDYIVAEVLGELIPLAVKITAMEPLQTSYDLCVPGNENFFISNGILAHNTYSIGGISLDIEKSSKYEGMKSNAEDQWDKLCEAKSRTTKYIRGLAQPRFGRGVRSSFGPHVGRGVLSPRQFI